MAREYHYCEECNHQTIVYGSNRAEAERKLKWFQQRRPLCNTCEGKKEYAEAAAKAKELELPALQGTPSQIEWAERIRIPKLVQLFLLTKRPEGPIDTSFLKTEEEKQAFLKQCEDELDRRQTTLAYLCSITAAEWWTDKYACDIAHLTSIAKRDLEHMRKPENDPDLRKQVDLETTIRPETPRSELIASVAVGSGRDQLSVSYPAKDDAFNEAVKAFSPEWKASVKQWLFQLPADQFDMQAAEICLHIVGSGFAIRVPDTPLRELILTGDVAKSDGRRIDYAGQDHFRVDWRRIDGDYYDEVRKIQGSKWDKANRTVLVPIGAADELRDFAQASGFQLTDGAQWAAEAFDEYRRNGMVAAGKKRQKGKVEPILPAATFPGTISIDPALLDT